MKSVMEPIYNFFLEPFIPCSPIVATDGTGDELSSLREVNDKSLSKIIGHAVKLHRLYGVEDAYYALYNPNWKFVDIPPKTLMQYYYFLTVINIERYDLEEMRKYLGKLNDYLKDIEKLEDEWHRRIHLLKVMAATLRKAEGWAEQVLPLFEGDLHSEPWFNFALYFGCMAREQELYDEADTLLKKALSLAPTELERAIVWCNLGALSFARDDWQTALKHYKAADAILDELVENIPDSELGLYRQEVKRNILVVQNLLLMSRDEFQITGRLPRLAEGEMALANKWEDIALGYVRNEVYEENLATRNSIRFSNNLYEAIRYFNRSEAANALLGNVLANRTLFDREVKAFINAGYVTNDRRLLQIALQQAVEINETKAIKGLIGDTIPFTTLRELEEFCQWIFKPVKGRRAKIGRVNCLAMLVDYLPDGYILQTLSLALEALSGQFSFTRELDFKRPGIKLLGGLLHRLPAEKQEEMIKRLWEEFEKQQNYLIRSEIVEQLQVYKQWHQISSSYRDELAVKMLEYLQGKAGGKDLWSSQLFYALVSLSQYLSEDMQKKVAAYVIEEARQRNSDAIAVLHNEWLLPFVPDDLWVDTANHLVELMRKEVAEESDRHRSWGGRVWGALLGIYLPYLKNDIQAEALRALFNYIDADNLLSYNRALALHNLSIFLSENKDVAVEYTESIKKICHNCLEAPRKEKERGFWYNLEDTDVLAAKAAWLLVTLNHEDTRQVVHAIMRRSLAAESDGLRECLLFLGRYAHNFQVDDGLFGEILGRFLGELKNPDERIRGAVAYYLPIVACKSKTEMYWPYILEIARRFSKDESRAVRLNLVQAIGETISSWPSKYRLDARPILKDLKNDLSFRVRSAARVWDREH